MFCRNICTPSSTKARAEHNTDYPTIRILTVGRHSSIESSCNRCDSDRVCAGPVPLVTPGLNEGAECGYASFPVSAPRCPSGTTKKERHHTGLKGVPCDESIEIKLQTPFTTIFLTFLEFKLIILKHSLL